MSYNKTRRMIHIVGGGLAGLYAAYKLHQRGLSVRVYEKSHRIGGRIGTIRFAGRDVPTGAGIGRGTDVLLRALCSELGVPVTEFTAEFKYRFTDPMVEMLDIKRTVSFLRRHVETVGLDRRSETFRCFATRVLGEARYRAFVAKTGYSDYEDADAVDTLYNYGFEDTVPGYTALRVDWARLLRRLGEELEGRIRLGVAVGRLRLLGRGVTIVATDIDAARKVTGKELPAVSTQPFARVYFSCEEDLDCGYTVCAPFQKIIQMGRGKGRDGRQCMVYMIYCDNETARRIERSRKVKKYIEDGVHEVFGKRVTVRECEVVYWATGTHYFPPLDAMFETREDHIAELQRPFGPNSDVYVVGEAVSAHQGWCEGALESVEAVIAAPEFKGGGHRSSSRTARSGRQTKRLATRWS